MSKVATKHHVSSYTPRVSGVKLRQESSKELDPEFIANMEALYAKNAYREDDIFSAKKPILRALHTIRQKRDENIPDLIDSDKDTSLLMTSRKRKGRDKSGSESVRSSSRRSGEQLDKIVLLC